MTRYIQVSEQAFFDYLENCDFSVRWMGNGSMGRDYFNDLAKRLVATYGHGFTVNAYSLIEQDEEGDEFTRDREAELLHRLNGMTY